MPIQTFFFVDSGFVKLEDSENFHEIIIDNCDDLLHYINKAQPDLKTDIMNECNLRGSNLSLFAEVLLRFSY